ncbi:MAG TPA: DEAD/DEAH box helicase [Segetibacter sp.]
MVAAKVETKVGMLLSPSELSNSYIVIESFQVFKSAKGIDFKAGDLNSGQLRKLFPDLLKDAKDIFNNFCSETIDHTHQELKQLLNKQKVGIPHDVYRKNAMIRQLQQSFEALKPFVGLVKWYHKIPSGDGRTFKTSPCVFNTYKPRLEFEVVKKADKLVLLSKVILNGNPYNLKDFKRYHFLLESTNEYFILSHKDYFTLDWLSRNDYQQYGDNATLFAEKILSKLEADYLVERNNHFTKKEIVTKPVNRVLLSELNNSFLMITPQWVYDGFVVEGAWKETYETVVSGEATLVKRDKEAEEAFVELLVSLHPNFANQRNGYYYVSFAEAQKKQWFLKAYHKLLELGIELVGMDMLNHFRYSQYKVETTTVVKSEANGRVVMQMNVAFGKEQLKLAELQKMLLAGQKAVLLKDGSLGILHDQWMHQYSSIVKHGKINKDEIEVSKFLAITQQHSPESQQVLKPLFKEVWWQKWQQWQNSSEPVYQLPPSVKATLRPYQQKGFEWLTLLSDAGAGACLADDMGLGKTLQTICFVAHYIHHNPGSVNIIVCPSSLIYNWQQELQKFTPGIASVVYHGASRNTADLENEAIKVIITSYGTLRADSGTLNAKTYGVAVIDESHNIKNPSSQIATAVSVLQGSTRIALSGTPVVNNTFDLYSQLNFALPGMFGSKEFFKREYADAIDRNHDEEKIKALQKLTAPFILRRTKEQVAKDLPNKTEMILWCNMSSEQKDLYNELKDQIKSNLFLDIKSQGLNKSKFAVLQGILKLRQVCNSPMLLPQEERQLCKQSVKTDVLMGELSNILKEHKALVFSQFSTMLHLLAKECDKQGIKYYHFDGQTPPDKRMEMVKAFQDKDDKTNLFLISLKAGNTGLTLTAADYVFLFDPWWNTAVEQQAINRTHRIGQTKNVFAYKIICKDTIEEKIVQLQQRKKQLAEELVSEDNGFIKSLNEEDIEYLFS